MVKLFSRSHSRAEKRTIAAASAATLLLGGAAIAGKVHSSKNDHPTIDTFKHSYRQVTAGPGDTLYGISERAEPSVDPRITSALIANTIALEKGITSEQASDVVPGEVIPLPDNAKIGQEVQVVYLGEK